jgi:hypothetical protein
VKYRSKDKTVQVIFLNKIKYFQSLIITIINKDWPSAGKGKHASNIIRALS